MAQDDGKTGSDEQSSGSGYSQKDAARDTEVSKDEVGEAWHSARQDAALEQYRTGEDWMLPDGYALEKVVERTLENDRDSGDSGK